MQGQDDFEAMMYEPAAIPLPHFVGPANMGSIEVPPWREPGRSSRSVAVKVSARLDASCTDHIFLRILMLNLDASMSLWHSQIHVQSKSCRRW